LIYKITENNKNYIKELATKVLNKIFVDEENLIKYYCEPPC
jgi:hypothetical protein